MKYEYKFFTPPSDWTGSLVTYLEEVLNNPETYFPGWEFFQVISTHSILIRRIKA